MGFNAFLKLALIFGIVLATTACSDPPPPPPPPPPTTIKQLGLNISEVNQSSDGTNTNIYIKKEKIWNSASVVFGLADTAIKITKGMRQYNLMPDTKKITFTALGPTKDKYGNEESSLLLSITYLRDDLMKINVGKSYFSPQDMLNLYESTSWVLPLSKSVIIAFCSDEISKTANRFCREQVLQIAR